MPLNYAAYHVPNHANDIATAAGDGKINDNDGNDDNDDDDDTIPFTQTIECHLDQFTPRPPLPHAIATIFNHLKEFSVANFYLLCD